MRQTNLPNFEQNYGRFLDQILDNLRYDWKSSFIKHIKITVIQTMIPVSFLKFKIKKTNHL